MTARRAGSTTSRGRNVLVMLLVTAIVHTVVATVSIVMTMDMTTIIASVPAATAFGIRFQSTKDQRDRRGDHRQNGEFSRHNGNPFKELNSMARTDQFACEKHSSRH